MIFQAFLPSLFHTVIKTGQWQRPGNKAVFSHPCSSPVPRPHHLVYQARPSLTYLCVPWLSLVDISTLLLLPPTFRTERCPNLSEFSAPETCCSQFHSGRVTGCVLCQTEWTPTHWCCHRAERFWPTHQVRVYTLCKETILLMARSCNIGVCIFPFFPSLFLLHTYLPLHPQHIHHPSYPHSPISMYSSPPSTNLSTFH